MRFAAIGTDGTRYVVWGLGSTESAARRNATGELRRADYDSGRDDAAEMSLTVVPVTSARAKAITAGDVGADDLMHPRVSSAAAMLGSKGGRARGSAKVRGDADYYRSLVARRRDR